MMKMTEINFEMPEKLRLIRFEYLTEISDRKNNPGGTISKKEI